MEIKTDKYTKVILTIIAITLICIFFKPEVSRMLTPQNSYARVDDTLLDASGKPISVFDVIIRNQEGQTIPVTLKSAIQIDPTAVIKVKWDEPMPVYIIEKKKN